MTNYNLWDLTWWVWDANLWDLTQTVVSDDSLVSATINPEIVEKITSTLDSITPEIEIANFAPDISWIIASVKTSVWNYLSPLIEKTTWVLSALAPYAVPISAWIWAWLISWYYIWKKHWKIKWFLWGLGIWASTWLATWLALWTVPLAVWAWAAWTLWVAWFIKEMAKKSPIPATVSS